MSCVDETESGNLITIGHIAHIEADSDKGPRANLSLSDQLRKAYPNLIVYAQITIGLLTLTRALTQSKRCASGKRAEQGL